MEPGSIMKAAFVHQPGPPESIVYGDLPVPDPGPSEVLVKVGAVAVNPIDTYVRSGLVATALPQPFIVGCDLSGQVLAAGDRVTRFRAGDHVWGSNQGLLGRQGTFADFVAIEERWLYPRPPEVRAEEAAALALVGITAHLGLFRNARLQSGETILVQGGSGGVGSAVVQMAKLAGARVITTAGTREKVERCQALGADCVVNYRSENVAARLREFAPGGVDIWWETSREPDFDQAVGLLADRGRMVVMAGREARPPFPVGPFYVKGCTLCGFAMFRATPDEQACAASEMNRWMVAGRLRAQIDRILPLAETAQAHRLQEENTLRQAGALAGKLVLKP
jgi:NADPH2:quinone reductase